MSEVFRIIAAQQETARLRRMVAYVQTHNPALSEDEAQAVVMLANYTYDPRGTLNTKVPDGPFTEKAKEMFQVLTDPSKRQDWLDKRNRIRNAPRDRAIQEHWRRVNEERMRQEVGDDAIPARGKTGDEMAVDMAKQVLDQIKRRKRTAPAPTPAQGHGRDGDGDSFASSAPHRTPPPQHPQPQPSVQESASQADDSDDDGSFDHSDDVIRRLRGMPTPPRPEF